MRQHRKAPRRRGRGFTLVETLFASVTFGLVIACLAWLTVGSASLSGLVTTTATLQAQTRQSLDLFVQDAHDSQSVVSSWSNGATTYTSDTTTTLVLQAPSFTYDAAGNPSATYTDHIVYHRVGAAAPYTLNRLVVPQAGSPRAAVPDTVVARNVQSVSFTALVSQIATGDGATTSFDLSAPVSGTGAGLVQAVTVNGTPVALGAGASQAQFVGPTTTPSEPQGTLQFGTAPPANAAVAALYSTGPGAATATAVSAVTLDLVVGATAPAQAPSATQTVEMATTSNLWNH